ncbi:uncharacterized protein HaLaN_04745 [Haematococcus lacustris]|uniref:Uncharacterized protein n=1 Tax=Haematococcus lacustris TaxID=44745 RepID=A0A699Z2E0_HAELA|nr:uncharacterized protein HaLaN_04745 [Haematococcus lacustris]
MAQLAAAGANAAALHRITGKNVVVVGGSRGIGLGLVHSFLERGNTVVATTRQAAAAGKLQELEASAPADRLSISELDVSCSTNVANWAQRLSDSTGLRHVDTNAMGPFFVTQQLVKAGLLGPPGSLVANITSGPPPSP